MSNELKLSLIVFCIVAALYFLESINCLNIKKSSDLNDDENASILDKKFAFNLIAKLGSNDNENMFLSPLSIASGLLMAYFGSKDATASELKSLLNLNSFSDDEILSNYKNQLLARNKFETLYSHSFELKMANKIFASVAFPLNPTYGDILKINFDSDVQQLNFTNVSWSAKIINDWIGMKTNHKINNIVSANSLAPFTKLILINAVYFKGTWVKKFKEANTKKNDFFLVNGNSVKVDMMNLESGRFDCLLNSDELEADVCELPYHKADMSMLLVLPRNNSKISQVESKLNPNSFKSILKNLKSQETNLHLPKFKFDYNIELKDYLIKMGASRPFTQSANFDRMTIKNNDFSISSVIHQTYIDVNELGTEAAAATIFGAVGLAMHRNSPHKFICNRPFIFIIYEKSSKSILFYGRLVKP